MRCPAHEYFPTQGAYIGCDFAGEVVRVGPNLKINIKVGDRVGASVVGGESPTHSRVRCKWNRLLTRREPYFLDTAPGSGAFTEYAKAFSDLVWKIPQETSFEQAVAFGSPYVSLSSSKRLFSRTKFSCGH